MIDREEEVTMQIVELFRSIGWGVPNNGQITRLKQSLRVLRNILLAMQEPSSENEYRLTIYGHQQIIDTFKALEERLSRLEEQVKRLKEHSHDHAETMQSTPLLRSGIYCSYNPDYKPVTDDKPTEYIQISRKVIEDYICHYEKQMEGRECFLVTELRRALRGHNDR